MSFLHGEEWLPPCDEHPSHLEPCYKPRKSRDYERELDDAETISKASLACVQLKSVLLQRCVLIAEEPATCSVPCRTQRRPSSAVLEALVSPANTERAVPDCSALSHSMLKTVPASSIVSQRSLCCSSLQMPYLLLNPTMPEMRPRMYPVFFGESIEVSPEPVQEIRYRWDWVGGWGFLSFSLFFFF